MLTWLLGRVQQKVALDKLKPMLEAKPGALTSSRSSKTGEFFLVSEQNVSPVLSARNLIPTEQLPEGVFLNWLACCDNSHPNYDGIGQLRPSHCHESRVLHVAFPSWANASPKSANSDRVCPTKFPAVVVTHGPAARRSRG